MTNFALMFPIILFGLGLTAANAADTAPDPAAALIEARAAIDEERFGAAITLLLPVVAADPTNADAFNLLGFASRKSGSLDEAAGYYTAALAINPSHFGALEYQGELFVMTNQLDAAKATLARLEAECAPCEEYDDLAEALADAGA